MSYKQSIFENVTGCSVLALYCCIKGVFTFINNNLIGTIPYSVLGIIALAYLMQTLVITYKSWNIISNRNLGDPVDNLTADELIILYEFDSKIKLPLNVVAFDVGFFISEALFSLMMSL